MLAPASHIDGGQLTVGLFALHGDMGLETRQRATCAEAETMNGRPGCQRHASRRKMCCLCALCLDLDLFKPCTRTDVMSDQRCRKPDAGLVPLGNLQLCSGSEADENRRMRRGRSVVALEQQHQRCPDSALDINHQTTIHHRQRQVTDRMALWCQFGETRCRSLVRSQLAYAHAAGKASQPGRVNNAVLETYDMRADPGRRSQPGAGNAAGKGRHRGDL